MKRSLQAVLALLAITVSAVSAWGEGSPVVLTHSLTGYSREGNSVTLNFAVRVENQLDSPLGALSLSLVPRPLFTKSNTAIKIDNLPAKATTTQYVKVVASLSRGNDDLAKMRLAWAGKYTASSGKVTQFPVTSGAGGAK